MPLFLLTACIGLNVNAVPTQDIYADDGDTREETGAVHFAVVGDTRAAVSTDGANGRTATPATEERIVRDISDAIQAERLEFVVMMGNVVRGSSTAEWKAFSEDWALAISGSELPETGTMRVRVAPVAGDDDRAGDDRLRGFGAAFPGVGADIGFNRVASWYAFDIVQKGVRYRMMVLDSDKEMLGSRWDEQLAWIPKACDGDYEGVLVFMHHPLHTLAKGEKGDAGGAPSELLEVVEDSTRIGMLKAVFAGETGTNEVYLPSGKFGEIYIVAGSSGAPASVLQRWALIDGQDLKLEPIFDLALIREFDKWTEVRQIPEAIVDKAHAAGSYEGFTGEYDAQHFPIQGWWDVGLLGKDMVITFRMFDVDGKLKDIYSVNYTEKGGWKIGG